LGKTEQSASFIVNNSRADIPAKAVRLAKEDVPGDSSIRRNCTIDFETAPKGFQLKRTWKGLFNSWAIWKI
jgi:hypothetical protein